MQALTVFSLILNLIVFIVFFIMAANVSRIKKIVESLVEEGELRYQSAKLKAEIKEFQGKPIEALDCYMEALFLLVRIKEKSKLSYDFDDEIMIREKIVLLGGKI